MPIRAVICDLFDVIFFTDNVHELRAYEEQAGLSPDAIKQAMLRSPQFREAIADHVSETELWRDVALTLHLDPTESSTLAKKFYSSIRLNDELIAFLGTLRPRYKTAILSNAPSTVRNLITQRFHLDQSVDKIILSSEVGTHKPRAEMYQLAASKLGVSPNEALFIDDETRFTRAAQDVGMHGIQFKDTQQTIADIRRALV